MTPTTPRMALVLLPLVAVACVQESRRTELYFGLSSPKGPITDQEFQQFLETEVTPRFPQGYTVLAAEGRWGENGRTIRENSRVLVLYRPAGSDVSRQVEAVRLAYVKTFKQQAVLRIDQPAKGSF